MATRDYTLGKGKVLFKKSGAAGYTDLGNAPAFTVSVTVDKLEHLSSRSGLSTKDLEVITKLGMAGSFTLDEPNSENLAMFVMSDAGAVAADQSIVAAGAFDTITDIVAGQWYPVTKSAVRIFNLDIVAVTGSVEGTDFLVDKVVGLFYAIPGGNLDAPATDAVFGATCTALALTKTATDGGTLTTLAGDLYFVGDPPQGRIIDVMGYCNLTPNGDWALIGTDWMQIQFNVEFLKVEGVDGLIHLTDRGKAGQL